MVEHGAVLADYHDRRVVRHFGDPAAEYSAATDGVAVFDRSHRARLRVSGRAPGRMLDGIFTGTIPVAAAQEPEGYLSGLATYHAVLTPKGKMITDLWALLPGPEEDPGFLLDVPVAGRAPLLETFAKVLPPRFAKVTDASETLGAISVVGPDAAASVSRLALGLRLEGDGIAGAEEGRWWCVGGAEGLIVVRTAEVWPTALNVIGPTEAVLALWRALIAEGASPAGLGVWATLRVEAGRPAYGTDMDEGTIPVEAGIHDRAIDYGKGCYTGQEVIVRIRDRGHVNRHLRRLRLGEGPAPKPGTELHGTGDAASKVVGRVTSAVQSPKYGGVVALAYVRRGVETVSYDGREVAVPTE
jgi:folate-binding protein YgfZ